LGAGIGKIASILRTDTRQAKKAMENFYESLPELKELKSRQIPLDARRGYFEGLDGRKVICDSEHLMLAGYLQNGEAIITKKWIQTWKPMATKFGLWHKLVDYVHDEVQTETLTESDGELLKMIQKKAMGKVNEELDLFCPMDVESKIGYNWAETH
jgi:DNA polymerase I-like protein with 3'-5' exonuclease and polymerase domains